MATYPIQSPPFRLAGGLPLTPEGRIDMGALGRSFGNYYATSTANSPRTPSAPSSDSSEVPEENMPAEDSTDTPETPDTSGEASTTEGSDPAGTLGNKPDISPQDTQTWVQDILNKFPEWRQAELDAEMRRYVLTGALRQQGLRELSRRKIEQENIAAWREVEKQRLASQSAQAIALANTAYLAQIPNTGVMEAMNNAMKAGISAGGLLSNTITPSSAKYFS